MKLKTFWLRTELWLPRGRDEIFQFFADPRNLDRLTPSWLQFRILSPADITMSKGTLLDYRLRIRGVPIRWQSEIARRTRPIVLSTAKPKDLYSLWLHEHTFAAHDGGTLVGDNVEYAVPGGTIVQKLLVAPDIARIFNYRHRVLQELFNPAQITPRQRTGT